MKKTVVLLTSALVLALGAPMVSAAPVDVTGTSGDAHRVRSEQSYEPMGTRTTPMGIKLSPSLNVGEQVSSVWSSRRRPTRSTTTSSRAT